MPTPRTSLLAAVLGAIVVSPIHAEPPTLDLATAMADPAWLGAFPERPRWTADGRLVFDRRVGETEERETLEIDPSTGDSRVLSTEERLSLVRDGLWNRDRTRMASSRNGDLVVLESDGTLRRMTRTSASERPVQWQVDGRLVLNRSGELIVMDLETGEAFEPVDLRFGEPPAAPETPEGLAADQRRLFETLRDAAERREAARVRREADRAANTHDVVGPVYLPPRDRETGRHLSPNGRWMLVEVAAARRGDAKRDDMAIWVTDDGYVTSRGLRPKVGTQDRTAERLVLIDLETATVHAVDLDDLPERRADRLASIRAENEAWLAEQAASAPEDATNEEEDSPGPLADRIADLAREAGSTGETDAGSEPSPIDPRPASIMQVDWHPDGGLAAVMLRSLDNKDRWIVALDPTAVVATTIEDDEDEPSEGEERPASERDPVRTIDHLHDPGWINWSFNEMDWTRDGSRLWFLSEAEGWSDLMAWEPGEDAPTGLVTGEFEIRDVREHPTDGTLVYRSNRGDPSVWRLERFEPTEDWFESLAPLEGWPREAMTEQTGMVERYAISPDGSRIAFLASTLDRPAELFSMDLNDFEEGVDPARRLTDSASETFQSLDWQRATLVDVPGRHGRDIRGRLHLPPDDAPVAADGRRPAVLFVHGAGYLQNAHAGWSRYFREGFFHDLLAREGYVVLDLDYRASSGYGRDWRTAIARDMGPCELDDYEDGIAWLAENHDVDPDRVGMYGGSYGGFTTLMGLLTRPGVFKAGAALRPVTDWSFYNDGYTANILNTPEVDPMAYRRSSPIEHAEGLEDALLMCHGMVDDNVPFSDTVRLAQRLIELGKDGWEVAIYPVEPHGFRETTSWIDEYRRIHALFDRTLRPR